jgi:hypothetical protein
VLPAAFTLSRQAGAQQPDEQAVRTVVEAYLHGLKFNDSAGKEEAGELRITALEVTNDIASVKVVEDCPGSRYTDYLSLVRFGGRWQIVNKIYTAEKR